MSKYNSKKVIIDWNVFDSKIEWDYYLDLLELKKEGTVSSFSLHPKFELQPKFVSGGKTILPINYVSDFDVLWKDGSRSVIDVKGMPTEKVELKRKMFLYKYPEIELKRVVRYQGKRVDYFENEKRKRENKKLLSKK